MPTQTFTVNGTPVSVDVEDDVRLLWVLRDILGVTGPKYGCGLQICQACTSHLNGETFNPCITPVGNLLPTDEVVTIEGLADTVDGDLHPVQQVWIDLDVAQCGFCQPGQIMAAVGLIGRVNAENRLVTDADIDSLENICRCGTYPRIRSAIKAAQLEMIATAALPATPVEPRTEVADATVTAEPVVAAALPSTGGTSLLGPAAVAAGTAVVVRSLANSKEPTVEDA